MKQNLIVVLALALGLVSLSVAVFKTPAQVVSTTDQPGETLGAQPGPDYYGPYLGLNDVKTFSLHKALATATSTPCAIQAPTTGTSTLLRTSVKIDGATSTATTWHVAKATSAFATTTLLVGPISLSSGAKGSMVYIASSTFASIDSNDTFAPGAWVVWGASGFLPAGTTKLTGSCEASWQLL
jgi:hypothetical protein